MKPLRLALPVVIGLAFPLLAAQASWVERARDAPLALVARCEAQSSRWEGGSIYTYSEVAALRVVRGVPAHSVIVRQRGGDVDGIGQRVSHQSLLEPGRTYLLFLAQDSSSSWSPTSTGVNLVDDSPDGQIVGGQTLEQVIGELGGAN